VNIAAPVAHCPTCGAAWAPACAPGELATCPSCARVWRAAPDSRPGRVALASPEPPADPEADERIIAGFLARTEQPRGTRRIWRRRG
jgi:hypothetical protein